MSACLRIGSNERSARAILLRLSRSCGKELALLQGAPEVTRRHANHAPEDLGEMTGAGVTDLERDLDEAVGRFADQLLGAGDAFSRHKLEWGHAGGLLEDA